MLQAARLIERLFRSVAPAAVMQGIAVPGSLRFGKPSRLPHKETPCPTIITSASNAASPCADRTFTAGGNPRRTAPNAANAVPSLPTNSPSLPNGTNTPGGSCRRPCGNTGKSAAPSLTAARTNGWRLWNAKLNCAQTENQRNAFRRETARCLQAMADIEKEINRFDGFTVR